jgi:hypothetical protein
MKENKELPFLKIPNDILKLTHIPSRVEVSDVGNPVMVDFTTTDKILYLTMKKRFEFFKATGKPNKVGSTFWDTHADVAFMCGVSVKTVTRFIKKWKEHGYIDYVNFAGNHNNYTVFEDIVVNDKNTCEVLPVETSNDFECFVNRNYINPEEDQEWRGY